MTEAAAQRRQLVPFAALSATYFAHIGFFNPYLPLWLKDLGLPIVVISLLTSVQSFTQAGEPALGGCAGDLQRPARCPEAIDDGEGVASPGIGCGITCA